MNWKRWRAGLLVSLVSGLFAGLIGLGLDMTHKQIIICILINIAKDGQLYLARHPADQVQDDPQGKPPGAALGIWILFWFVVCMFLTGCGGSLDRKVFRLESAAVGTADGAMQGYALYYKAATNNPAAFNRTLESLTLEREQAKGLAAQVGASAEMTETLRLSYKTNAAVEPALRASVATLNANMQGIVTFVTNVIHIKPTN